MAITPAAAGQRIKTLEDYLGIPLLERGRAGIRPSEELAAAVSHLHQGFAALEAAARELDLQRWHEIHLAAASDFAELWLAPRLPRFREQHPNIRFCITGAGDVPMRLGRVDCEIGFGPIAAGPDGEVLFHDYAVPIASPANFDRVSTLPAETRLEGFPLLHLDFYKDDPAGISWPQWIAAHGVARTAPERGMRFQRIADVLGAVQANAGLSLCGVALILDRIDQGGIRLPYPASAGTRSVHAFAVRFRPDSAAKPHIARFRDWLREEAERTAAAVAAIAGGTA